MEVVITGGIVNCVEGVRVWARLDDGPEVLILILPRNSLKNETDCTGGNVDA